MPDKRSNREMHYTALISEKIGELFEDGSLDIEDLNKGDNLTSFIHALTNIVPFSVYNKLTGQDLDMLGFQHVAQRIYVQNLVKEDE